MKSLDESSSDKDSDEESDEEESGSDSDKESGGSVPVFDAKLSHSSWKFDKKTKFFICNNSSWFTAISKKKLMINLQYN